MGLRVSEEEALEGLDYGEHGMHAYDLSLGGGFSPALGASAMPSPSMATRLATSENG
jgi:hypothetical protein